MKKFIVSNMPNLFSQHLKPEFALQHIDPILTPDFIHLIFGPPSSTVSLFTFGMETRQAKIWGKIIR